LDGEGEEDKEIEDIEPPMKIIQIENLDLPIEI